MRKVFRYMRVSTDRQAQDGYSLEAQDTVLRDYAAGHSLEIVATFVESESAFTSGVLTRVQRIFKEYGSAYY